MIRKDQTLRALSDNLGTRSVFSATYKKSNVSRVEVVRFTPTFSASAFSLPTHSPPPSSNSPTQTSKYTPMAKGSSSFLVTLPFSRLTGGFSLGSIG